MTGRVGHKLNEFQVIDLLGSGASAEVYKGFDTHLKRDVALKVPPLGQTVTPQELNLFQAEAQKLAGLKHAHIVKIWSYFNLSGTPVLVMEYAPEGSLRKVYPRDKPLKPTEILPYVKQIADALNYLHEQGITHRDIKPENLLLTEKHEVLLSDFGIALMQRGTSSTNPGGTAGTVQYMAPEQLQAHAVAASDQYSLGIVVYEWLTGAPPFSGSLGEVVGQHLHTAPPSLRAKVPSLSPELEQVVLKALAKKPEERFESVLAFAREFERVCSFGSSTVIKGQAPYPLVSPQVAVPAAQPQPSHLAPQGGGPTPPPPPAGQATGQISGSPSSNLPTQPGTFGSIVQSGQMPGSSPGSFSLPPPRKEGRGIPRRVILIVGGVALLAGGGVAFVALSKKQNPGSAGATATPHPSATVGPTNTAAPTVTATPAAASTPGSFPHPSIPYTYTGHSNEIDTVAWSPDGTRIVSGSRDITAQVWQADTGNQLVIYSGHSDWVRAVAWSPDSTHIASGSQDATVQVWDAATGSQKFTYRGHGQVVVAVAWSPDGSLIASGGSDQTVQVWDATNGNLRNTFRGHAGTVNGVCWSPDSRFIASASDDHKVYVWDALTGRVMTTYTQHTKEVQAVAWSPDGRYIASASQDKTAHIWEPFTGNPVLTYRGHADLVLSVAWAFDSQRVASGSADKTAQVWNALTGAHIVTYIKHTNWVHQVSWAPDGTWVVSGSADHRADVWQSA